MSKKVPDVTPLMFDSTSLISDMNMNVRRPASVCSGVHKSLVQSVLSKMATFAPEWVHDADSVEYDTSKSGYPSQSKSPKTKSKAEPVPNLKGIGWSKESLTRNLKLELSIRDEPLITTEC
ncbi:hypothetical protein DI09_70p20 [Mitosporidium daphniae]|uniref:Uncharacterized protein n=1 Tax=Mitosporidium daphniae TaxID=1485682 RepID=A0A098VMX3_9MICR|nr:uncharacterized protein DI09_70p20 [Mitosporidium daphniae]KGG50407.1 hypothetical protein DI09_70p20 [Mitosporidium daphniae]|eukprot:XP_013236845.1 uncharacterized protein DI09_70p20 [Mitosporidium daphniae]